MNRYLPGKPTEVLYVDEEEPQRLWDPEGDMLAFNLPYGFGFLAPVVDACHLKALDIKDRYLTWDEASIKARLGVLRDIEREDYSSDILYMDEEGISLQISLPNTYRILTQTPSLPRARPTNPPLPTTRHPEERAIRQSFRSPHYQPHPLHSGARLGKLARYPRDPLTHLPHYLRVMRPRRLHRPPRARHAHPLEVQDHQSKHLPCGFPCICGRYFPSRRQSSGVQGRGEILDE